MFVLPPPPRYPTGYHPGTGQLIETNNLLSRPAGAELVVSEGTYVLREEILLATPPPHPQDQTVHQPINPLATHLGPPTAGTKLSLTVLAPRNPVSHRLYRAGYAAGSTRSVLPPSISENPRESLSSEGASQQRSNGDLSSSAAAATAYTSQTTVAPPAFGEGNPALATAAPTSNGKNAHDSAKRRERKPKNNILKSNSAFVSRVITHESLGKRLQDRSADGLFAFANVNRALQWLDLSSANKEENLTKVLFTRAHALCHDVNSVTKSTSHIDVILGFSTGDIIWYEPMSQKYSRINKNAAICSAPVSDIRWLPGSENLFMAAHMDGSIVIYDKEKEDAPFEAEEGSISSKSHDTNHSPRKSSDVKSQGSEQSAEDADSRPKLRVRKSVQSRNQKSNPVAYWKLANQKPHAFSFSPDGRHLAIVSDDGTLRVLDYIKEQLLDVFRSYYGGLTCVCWSPDGRYIVTGGQDDLLSIWSLTEQTLVARCQGHNSWVTAVAFDPWRCDDRVYRFGSVGEDRQLLLWDFSVGMLHRPRAASVRQRPSMSQPLGRTRTESTTTRVRSNSTLQDINGDSAREVIHPVEPRSRTAMLPPVMAKQVDDHPLCWLGFEEDCIMASCRDGHIRTWDRPKEGTGAGEDPPSRPGSARAP